MLTASAQDATPATSPATGDSLLAELGYPEIRLTTDGTTHDFPTELAAGRYHVVLENQDDMDVDLEVAQLPGGMTLAEVDVAGTDPDSAVPQARPERMAQATAAVRDRRSSLARMLPVWLPCSSRDIDARRSDCILMSTFPNPCQRLVSFFRLRRSLNRGRWPMAYKDPIQVSPDNYRLLLEDGDYRLVEMWLPAGSRSLG